MVDKKKKMKTKIKKQEYTTVIGCHLLTQDNMYVVGIDYDNYDIRFLQQELKGLQCKYNLSTFYVLNTSNRNQKSYHAISFSKVTVAEYESILHNTHCDIKFKKRLNYYGEPKVLRLTKKDEPNTNIKHVGTIISKYGLSRMQSKGHKLLYNYLNIIPYKPEHNEDNNLIISLVLYETPKK